MVLSVGSVDANCCSVVITARALACWDINFIFIDALLLCLEGNLKVYRLKQKILLRHTE